MDAVDHTLISPMLAKAVGTVPEPDAVPGGLSYEPKWDGFRAIVYFDGTDVEIGSRGSKMLTRYFPELVEAFVRLLPGPCTLDGEIAVRTGPPGHERLDWDALSQRIHPAASRVLRLSSETPALFIAFDVLSLGGRALLDVPFVERRAQLEELAGPCRIRCTSPGPRTMSNWHGAGWSNSREQDSTAWSPNLVRRPTRLVSA